MKRNLFIYCYCVIMCICFQKAEGVQHPFMDKKKRKEWRDQRFTTRRAFSCSTITKKLKSLIPHRKKKVYSDGPVLN